MQVGLAFAEHVGQLPFRREPDREHLFEGLSRAGISAAEFGDDEPTRGDPRRGRGRLPTRTGRWRGSFHWRNTALTFKGKSVDPRQIGKELRVRYVLEGSVQRDQNQVRINAQLIDAESGGHLVGGALQQAVRRERGGKRPLAEWNERAG